jgi:hypothetical protein
VVASGIVEVDRTWGTSSQGRWEGFDQVETEQESMNHEKDQENRETQPLYTFWQYCNGSPGPVYDDVILPDLAEKIEERQNSSEGAPEALPYLEAVKPPLTYRFSATWPPWR